MQKCHHHENTSNKQPSETSVSLKKATRCDSYSSLLTEAADLLIGVWMLGDFLQTEHASYQH